jgi:hypothetical protein
MENRLAHVSNPVRVAIIGHSYVKRLEAFTRCNNATANLGFPVGSVNVRFFGLGGGSLEPGRRQSMYQVVEIVREFQPIIIFLHVGENNINKLSPSRLMSNLFSFCDALASIDSVTTIVISHLFLFPVHISLKEYVEAGNRALYAVGADCINVDLAYSWKHRIGACGVNAQQHVFHHDKVHLTSLGMKRYMKSVRTAVGQAVKKVRGQH